MRKLILTIVYLVYAGMRKKGYEKLDSIFYSLSVLASLSTLVFILSLALFASNSSFIDKNDTILDFIVSTIVVIIFIKMMILYIFFFKSDVFEKRYSEVKDSKVLREYPIESSILAIAFFMFLGLTSFLLL